MQAGLKEFIVAYAKDKQLPEVDVALLAGALSYKYIEGTTEYKEFVVTLNQVAPHLIGYIMLAGK